MSVITKITPYKNKKELLYIRHLFYDDPGNLKSLEHAVTRVALWQTRGKLPHAVDATTWIVSVVLSDTTITKRNGKLEGTEALRVGDTRCNESNYLTLRNAYSMALIRFVNGILDPFQQGTFAMALLTLAKDIGLPHSFVEIRHWATHEHLPSLDVLRETIHGALGWLYQFFWASINLAPENKCSVDKYKNCGSKKSEILSSLKAYRTFSKRSNVQVSMDVVLADGGEAVHQLKSISTDDSCSFHLAQILALDKPLIARDPSFTSSAAYRSLLELLHANFVFRLIIAILQEFYYTNSGTLRARSELSTLTYLFDWIDILFQSMLRGPFPLKLHQHVYLHKEDIVRFLRNLCTYLNCSEEVLRHLQDIRIGVPLLEEILHSQITVPDLQIKGATDFDETTETPFKKRKPRMIFQKPESWKVVLFGTVSHRTR